MNSVGYFVNLIMYEIICIIFSVPFVLIFLLLLPLIENAGIEMKSPVGFLILSPLLVWYFVGSPWIAKNAAKRRIYNNESLWSSFTNAVSEGKVCLAFLPVIGKYFENDSE